MTDVSCFFTYSLRLYTTKILVQLVIWLRWSLPNPTPDRWNVSDCWFALHMTWNFIFDINVKYMCLHRNGQVAAYLLSCEFLICFIIPSTHSRHIFSSIELLTLLLVLLWILYHYPLNNMDQILKTKSQQNKDRR